MSITLHSSKKLLCALLLTLPLSFAFAQESTQEPSSKKADDEIEVIGVTGQKPLAFFRLEAERAELDFYQAYNALIDDTKFRVVCRNETRPGSRVRDKVCYPQYVLDRMAEETQDVLSAGGTYPTLKEIEFAVKEEREESMAYVEKIVTENPHLLEKLIDLNQKQNQYAAKKAEK